MGWPFRIFLGSLVGVFLLMTAASYQGWGIKPLGAEKIKAQEIYKTGPTMRGATLAGGRSGHWGK
jgi:hypothetical protein